MTEITYKISIGENGQLVEQKEVSGFLAFEMYSYQWAVHKEAATDEHFEWVISEVSTGFALLWLDDLFTRDQIIARAKAYLIHKGEVMVIHHVEKAREFLSQSV